MWLEPGGTDNAEATMSDLPQFMAISLLRFQKPRAVATFTDSRLETKVRYSTLRADSFLIDGTIALEADVFSHVALCDDRKTCDKAMEELIHESQILDGIAESIQLLLRPFMHRGNINWLDPVNPGPMFATHKKPRKASPVVSMTSGGFIEPGEQMERVRSTLSNTVMVANDVLKADGLQFRRVFSLCGNFGDGVTSTEQSPVHLYPDTGVYQAVLIANPGWPCADTAYSTVNVYPGMTAIYNYITACADSDIVFTDHSVSTNGDITNWTWDFDDGNFSTDTNTTHNYAIGGFYDVSLTTVNDKGCVDVMTQQIYVYPQPQVDFEYSEPCINTQIDFNNLTTLDSGWVVSWNWDVAGLHSDTSQNTSYTFSSVGIFDVTLTAVSDHGCETVYSESLFIKPLPVSNAGPDTVFCSGDAIVIGTPPTAGYTYLWEPDWGLNDKFSSSPGLTLINDSNVIVSHPYTVLTTADGCSLMDTVTVGVFPEINASIPVMEEQCLPENSFFLQPQGVYGPNANFQWTMGDGIKALRPTTIPLYRTTL